MMGAKEISLMKPGSLLINASRGTVVDIPALCDALASKHLAGAAIDVFPTEPRPIAIHLPLRCVNSTMSF